MRIFRRPHGRPGWAWGLLAAVLAAGNAAGQDAAPSAASRNAGSQNAGLHNVERAGDEGQVSETVLDNGLKVIVKEDHRAPVVVSQIWYRAGSMDELTGTTGVAHALEHMMFKGTAKVPAGEFSQRIAAAGGRENAFTSRDYTAYFQQLQKDRLPLAFELESDRMRNLRLAGAEFAKEIQVVMEERRWRTDDNPESLVYEEFMATALDAHPYRHPTVGWMNDLNNMTVEDARRWYDAWYAPNNAILVVVGDVRPAEVFALARKHYGPIAERPLPVRKPHVEPPQLGVKRLNVKAPANLPYLLMGYRAPTLDDPKRDWEPYALEVLAGVLDGNDSARLKRALVKTSKVATAVGAGYDAMSRGPGLFLVDGNPSEGKTVLDVEAAVRAVIKEVQDGGVSEAELKRVKTQVIAAQVYQRDSTFYQAMLIGQTETIGFPHETLDLRIRKLQDVTAAQVRDVARKYLRDDRLTVATLDPQPMGDKAPAGPPAGMRPGELR